VEQENACHLCVREVLVHLTLNVIVAELIFQQSVVAMTAIDDPVDALAQIEDEPPKPIKIEVGRDVLRAALLELFL
jgi:hypothetical protein